MVSIGIAAYNEEKNIKTCLFSLEKSFKSINLGKPIEFFVCLNGCNDQTERIVREVKEDFKFKLTILHSKKGKLNSHKKIIENIMDNDLIFFCDADVIIPPRTINSIIKIFEENNKIKIISGYPYVIKPKKLSFFKQMKFNVLNLKRIYPQIEVARNDVSEYHDSKDKFLRKSRIYFHGRFFAIRDKKIYHFPYKGSKIRGDDTFLSRIVLSKYGKKSIKVLFYAPIYCAPLNSVSDYLRTWYRIRKDIDIINKEYPQFREFNKKTEMTVNWEYLRGVELSVRLYAFLFFALRKFEKYSYYLIRNFIYLDKIWSYNTKNDLMEIKENEDSNT
jgi:hypothetical protein